MIELDETCWVFQQPLVLIALGPNYFRMGRQRILACGDNHGNTESLEKLVKQTRDMEFEFIIHTGDITNAWKRDLNTGVKQLRAVEPYFEILAERGTLVYIYGNRDKERGFNGEAKHVTDEYELDVGHRLPSDDSMVVDGQRFTSVPNDADSETILLTHGLSHHEFYQSPARAYFSGDTHYARHFETALNTGYLHNDKGFNGAYFICELSADGMDVMVKGISDPWKAIVCPDHEWYGQQFIPESFECGLCRFGNSRQFRRIGLTVFQELSSYNQEYPTASIGELVTTARDHIVNDDRFASQFRDYLEGLAEGEICDPRVPIQPTGEVGELQLRIRRRSSSK